MTIRFFGFSKLPASARKQKIMAETCRKALSSEKADRAGELSVIFLDRKKMLALNKQFLNHHHDTDVIAFAYPGAPGLKNMEAPFGDIFISIYQAKIQAREIGHPLIKEIRTLIIHGILHLLGHDDAKPKNRALMFKKQEEILSRI